MQSEAVSNSITNITTILNMEQNFPLEKIAGQFKQVLLRAPVILGNDALNFFLDSFKRQAWIGNSIEPWQPRKTVTKWGPTKRNKGRAILIDTGRLRRSIRVTKASEGMLIIGTDVPYAKAHNEGVRMGYIQSVKAFTRKTKKGKTIEVKAHTRKLDMRLPKRQFMGQSPILTKQLARRLTAELMKATR